MNRKTNVYINLDNLGYNVKTITKKYSNYKYFFGVVKSDCYGHGKNIVNELIDNGINYLAVSYLNEAIKIRRYNKNIPILCMQPVSLEDIEEAIKYNVTIIIHDIDYFNNLLNLKLKSKLKVHIKLDTGMNRLGLKDKKEVLEIFNKIKSNNNIELEGIFSHFATIGLFDKNFNNQIDKFKELTSLIDLNEIPIIHFGSSVTLLAHKKLDFVNGIRIGILMYGYNVGPIKSEIGLKNKLRNIRNSFYQKIYNIKDINYNVKLDLKPSMSMKTHIIQIKNIKKGEYIGYSTDYKVKENMRIAILPIGYSNGIGKYVNNRYVLINNKKYYAVGSICMNMMFIEIDNTVNINDEVIILGDKISLGIFSRFNNSSLSETLLNIGNNNNRKYIKNNKIIEGE